MPDAVPNYLTTDSTGHVGANFTGKVHAQGLDLDAGLSPAGPDINKVRWIRQVDGAVIADIIGFPNQTGVGTQLAITTGDALTGAARILLAGLVPNGSVIQASCGGSTAGSVTVIDNGQHSDFVQGGACGGVSGTVATGINFWGGFAFNLAAPAKNGLLVVAQGSGFVNVAPANINYQLLIDGVLVAQSNFFFNNAVQHLMLPMLAGKTGALAAGAHTISFSNPISTLSVDVNDACAAGWIG